MKSSFILSFPIQIVNNESATVEEFRQLFIPDMINVGYVKRSDTYTGKLGFVIYWDQKGVLRKEKAWEGWRDKKIKADSFKNEPTEGFVLNRDVGGARRSYGWDVRIEKVRVYDPRGFEFEITVPNVLFILKECDCSRGKGLEGKFVYSWDRNELILLPATCEEYKRSQNFTDLQSKTVKSKELIQGASYITKRQEILTFVGRFDYYFMQDKSQHVVKKDVGGTCKKFVFHTGKGFILYNDLKNIASLQSDVVSDDLADLQQRYWKSEHGSKIVKLFLKDVPNQKPDPGYEYDTENWYYEESPGTFVECSTSWNRETKYDHALGRHVNTGHTIDYISKKHKFTIVDGILIRTGFVENPDGYHKSALATFPGNEISFRSRFNNTHRSSYRYNFTEYTEPTTQRLFAKLENGTTIKLDYCTFQKDNGR